MPRMNDGRRLPREPAEPGECLVDAPWEFRFIQVRPERSNVADVCLGAFAATLPSADAEVDVVGLRVDQRCGNSLVLLSARNPVSPDSFPLACRNGSKLDESLAAREKHREEPEQCHLRSSHDISLRTVWTWSRRTRPLSCSLSPSSTALRSFWRRFDTFASSTATMSCGISFRIARYLAAS